MLETSRPELTDISKRNIDATGTINNAIAIDNTAYQLSADEYGRVFLIEKN